MVVEVDQLMAEDLADFLGSVAAIGAHENLGEGLVEATEQTFQNKTYFFSLVSNIIACTATQT